MDTVRIARDLGDVSVLFPEGVNSLTELPHTLFEAIRQALTILRFEEQADEDEIPSREMWLDRKRLKQHMMNVKRARKAKYSNGDGDIADEPIDGPVEENALMAELGLKR